MSVPHSPTGSIKVADLSLLLGAYNKLYALWNLGMSTRDLKGSNWTLKHRSPYFGTTSENGLAGMRPRQQASKPKLEPSKVAVSPAAERTSP
jgi:hypothetical protein